jgi:hypothetical protein
VTASRGRRRLRRVQGKAPAGGEDARGCPYFMMPADPVNRVVEARGGRVRGGGGSTAADWGWG